MATKRKPLAAPRKKSGSKSKKSADFVLQSARNTKLDDLVFYAVDKASPYALAQFPSTNTIDKIDQMTLLRLGITDQGTAIMWLWINAHCQPEAKPVLANIASTCKSVGDVRTAVIKSV